MQTVTKQSGPMTMVVELDFYSWVELEGQNARLYYRMHNLTSKAYDGKIEGLPESVLLELEDMGAIKAH